MGGGHFLLAISLRKNPFFSGCSKMALPAAGRQMQVELCEIPLAGAPEIPRSEAYLAVRRNDLPC